MLQCTGISVYVRILCLCIEIYTGTCNLATENSYMIFLYFIKLKIVIAFDTVEIWFLDPKLFVRSSNHLQTVTYCKNTVCRTIPPCIFQSQTREKNTIGRINKKTGTFFRTNVLKKLEKCIKQSYQTKCLNSVKYITRKSNLDLLDIYEKQH